MNELMQLNDIAYKHSILIELTGRGIIIKKYFLIDGETKKYCQAYSLFDIENIDINILINNFLDKCAKEVNVERSLL
jgi:hypothetical protein